MAVIVDEAVFACAGLRFATVVHRPTERRAAEML
jgi:hypothetical protein